jgi:aspartokinase-like uncharacterized kinase
VTSDSIALWLARRLGAPRLLLIKSASLTEGQASAEELVATGVLDRAFPGLVADYVGDIRCVGRGSAGELADLLAGRSDIGTRVVP